MWTIDAIILHPDWWECECDTDFLHAKSVKLECLKCGAIESECPDARVSDLKAFGLLEIGRGES